jgi:hypothetical protein
VDCLPKRAGRRDRKLAQAHPASDARFLQKQADLTAKLSVRDTLQKGSRTPWSPPSPSHTS